MLCSGTVLLVLDLLHRGPSLGELSGGNWMTLQRPVVATAPGDSQGRGPLCSPAWKLLCLYLLRGLTS
jgi:hypothetical protein